MWGLYDTFRFAEDLFAHRDYRTAAKQLERLLEQASGDAQLRHGLGEARLLLARSYYHSAQLKGAERTLRELLDDEPDNGYALLMLGRTLERGSRHDEAAPYLASAAAMGLDAA